MRLIRELTARSIRVRVLGTKVPLVLSVAIVVLIAGSYSGLGQSASTDPAPDEIIRRMVQQNEIRAAHLKYFTSVRHYHVEFHGMGRSIAADMHVQATYTSRSGKTFTIIDESGSHLLLDHVLKKLLETERDDSRQQRSALTPSNYNFNFQTKAFEDGRTFFVFAVEPKVKSKLLYRGKIWIDAADYGVVRVEAQPAENPSFWIKRTKIHHVYARNGEFWLPQSNRSESKTRLGGSAVLTIDYGTYQLEEPHGITPTGATEVAARRLVQDMR